MTLRTSTLRTLLGGVTRPEVVGIVLRMWRLAGVRPWHLVLSLALSVLIGLAEGGSFALLIPLSDGVAEGSFAFLQDSPTFAWVTDLATWAAPSSAGRDMAVAVTLLLLILVSRVVKVALELLRTWWVTTRDARFLTRAGRLTFRRITGFGPLYFQRRPLGHIDAELTWAASPLQVLGQLEGVVLHALRLVMKLGLVLAISVHLFGSLLVSLALLAALSHLVSLRASALAERSAWVHRVIREEALDVLRHVAMLSALRQERTTEERYARRLGEVEDVRAQVRRIGMVNSGVVEVTILAGALAGEVLILAFVPGSPAGHLTRFCAFFLVAQQCLPDIQALSQYLLIFVDQVPRLEALARIYEDDGKFTVPSGERPFSAIDEQVELRGLRFAYDPEVPVLRGVTATIPARRVTALVGASGSGKTTIANLLVRMYDCDPGTILVDGTDIREYDLQSLRGQVFMVGHDSWVLNRSLRENICLGIDPAPDDAAVLAALDEVALASFVRSLPDGLDTELGDDGTALSEGQRQRLALVRLLLRDPSFVILDEATSALDSETEAQVWTAMKRHLDGRTVLLVSHRLSTVRLADEIVVLGPEGVLETGSWDDLAHGEGHFRRLFAAQFERGGSSSRS